MLHLLAQAALDDAQFDTRNLSHARRSAAWVSALANRLATGDGSTESQERALRAFCRTESDNRTEFRTNELLFDILIAEDRTVNAARGKPLTALSRAVWIVESELKRSDSRDVLIDLNKLVLGKADNKVLVVSSGTPLVAWAQGVMREMLDPTESNIFLVTIPHPADWFKNDRLRADVFQLTGNGWLTASSSGQPTAAAHVER